MMLISVYESNMSDANGIFISPFHKNKRQGYWLYFCQYVWNTKSTETFLNENDEHKYWPLTMAQT